VEDLKERVFRGGLARLCGQGINFILRLGYTATMARLLHPEDFGVVAMVVAVTGVYDLFTTAGLSLATVQRKAITDEQISTLFWINLLVGMLLCVTCVATAPLLVAFYHEPRLFWVTVAMGAGFLFNAAGVQHSALLQRQLRYVDLTIIEVSSLFIGFAFGISLAISGSGYWALVGAAIAVPAVSSCLMWFFTAWVPQFPRRGVGIRAMLSFGGTITINNLIVYFAYNLDKLLVGRFWGATSLGVYGTAYQLANVPTNSLIGAVGGVAFSALSRLQDDAVRLKNYFLKGATLLVSITAPITIFSAVFANEIVLVILGPKWVDAALIFRLLTPTILVFSIINPTGWLLQSTGLQVRSLRIAMVIAPLVITAYVIGLPYGPKGVALGFSMAMVLWVVPHVLWCLHDTQISPREFFSAISRPFFAAIAAVILPLVFTLLWLDQLLSPFFELLIAGCMMVSLYLSLLLFVFGGGNFYWGILRGLKSSLRTRSL